MYRAEGTSSIFRKERPMRDLDGTTDDSRSAARDAAVQERMNDPNASGIEKALAAFIGAAEGFAEEARKANLPALAQRAVEVTTETVDEVKSAVRESRPQRSADGALSAAPAPGSTLATEDYVGSLAAADAGLQLTDDRSRERGRFAEKASHAFEKAEHVATAVGESGRRALEAPTAIRHHVKTTTKELARDAADLSVGFLAAGLFAFFALAFFSVVVAVALNEALGGHMGTFLVGLFYLIVAAVLGLLAMRAVKAAKEDARRGMDSVKGEARAVTQPLRGLRA